MELESEKNQEDNIVFDTKRRRVENNKKVLNDGPVDMTTDGTINLNGIDKIQEKK